jgi:hypothetical protein
LGFSLCSRRGDIFIWTKLKSCHEIGNFERGKRERQTGQRVGFLQECRSRGVSAANPTMVSGWRAILKSSGWAPSGSIQRSQPSDTQTTLVVTNSFFEQPH